MPKIGVAGATLELPDGASDEAVAKAIADFRASPDFDKLIDKRSGAPARVRMIVGGAPEQDRLANLQRFYPDAMPYGDENFVFTDPASGKPVLYNPPGLDLAGDVASVAREVSQTVGAGLGAVGGTFAAGPGLGTAAGAGVGSAAGGALFDTSMNVLEDRVDTRGLAGASADVALDTLGGAVGQRGGELLQQGVKRALGGGKQAAQVILDRFTNLGVPAPAGAVGGGATAIVTKMLEVTPTSAGIMRESAEKTLTATKAAAERVAKSFGPTGTAQEAGETIRQAAVGAAERFGFRQEKLYAEVFDLIGAETPVAVASAKALREQMEQELTRAPRSLESALKPAMDMLRQLELDALDTGGGVPFAALRQLRTAVGKDLANPVLAGSTGAQNEAKKRIYGALTEDLSAAAKATGPEAEKKLAVADRYTRAFMSQSSATMQKIADFSGDEQAFRYAMTRAADGGSQLARLRRNFTPEEWDTVAGTVLHRMGRAAPGAQDAGGDVFSVNTFITNWNRLSPEAKQSLFGGNRYRELRPELDRLVEAVSSLKGLEKFTNTSNTSNNLIAFSVLQAGVGALGGLATGNDPGGAAVAGLLAPPVVAKLITSPAFVRWLATPITKPGALSAHIGRLTAIAVAEPEIRDELAQFTAALRQVPAPSRSRARATVRGIEGTPGESTE